MESANLKLTEHELIVGSSPSNLGDPSNCFAFGISNKNHHPNWSNNWSNNISSSSTTTTSSSSTTTPFDYTNYDSGVISNSSSTSNNNRSSDHNNNNKNLVLSDNHGLTCSNIVVNGLELIPTWNSTSTSSNQGSYDMPFERIKEEISESFPKFTELLNSPSSTNIDSYDHFLLTGHVIKNNNHHCDDQIIPGAEFPGHSSDSNVIGFRGQFGHIHPSLNVNADNYHNTHQYYGSLKPTFDHLASARFMSHQLSLNDNIGLAVFGSNSFGELAHHDHLHQSHDKLSNIQRISSINSKTTDESEITSEKISAPNKKSRMESRAPSCPPFKVRKEKLGDRIAALQQLVSPFGKTDTASVLMEAIGYIKFLQNQVEKREAYYNLDFAIDETLSVPYMKSLRNKSTKTIMQGVVKDNGSEEAKGDLRSRGLCLVPLSCMSYVTGDHGGGASIWPPPPNFGDT